MMEDQQLAKLQSLLEAKLKEQEDIMGREESDDAVLLKLCSTIINIENLIVERKKLIRAQIELREGDGEAHSEEEESDEEVEVKIVSNVGRLKPIYNLPHLKARGRNQVLEILRFRKDFLNVMENVGPTEDQRKRYLIEATNGAVKAKLQRLKRSSASLDEMFTLMFEQAIDFRWKHVIRTCLINDMKQGETESFENFYEQLLMVFEVLGINLESEEAFGYLEAKCRPEFEQIWTSVEGINFSNALKHAMEFERTPNFKLLKQAAVEEKKSKSKHQQGGQKTNRFPQSSSSSSSSSSISYTSSSSMLSATSSGNATKGAVNAPNNKPWRTHKCTKCNTVGHDEDHCRAEKKGRVLNLARFPEERLWTRT